MEDEHISSLEQVRRRLYNPDEASNTASNLTAQRPAYETRGWDKLRVKQITKATAERMSGPARFLVAAFVLFVLTLGGTGLYLYLGGRQVSTDNVRIRTEGPATIASGDTVPLRITIDNKNPVALRDVTITVMYPEGTKDPLDPTKPLTSYSENVGSIPSGARVEKTLRASVYGSEGAQLSLPIKVQYKTDGSTSVFEINKQYGFAVTSSPIALAVSSLSQVSSGQPFTVKLTVKNNATTKLDDVAVRAEYPFGFVLSSTEPPSRGPFFHLGTLAPGEERTISVTGSISGESSDERIFKFAGGTAPSEAAAALSTIYSNKEVAVRITQPFLATKLSIGGDSGENPSITLGAPTEGVVTWTNNLPSAVTNAQIEIKLSGEALDPASVRSGTGFYRSADSTLVFNGETAPALKNLAAGASGQATFSFATKKPAQLSGVRSPSVTMTVSISGQRLGESGVPEAVSGAFTRVARAGTNLTLSSRALYSTGAIKNSGPWPPQVNKETTYTIELTLSSGSNSVGGGRVTATLPNYVRYTGSVSPAGSPITYSEASRTVTWNAGDVDPGKTKSISFQVGLTPSISQAGTAPVLLNTQTVTGTDRFTQKEIQGTVDRLTTDIAQDPAYTGEKGKVQ